jgi:hypothetical protein
MLFPVQFERDLFVAAFAQNAGCTAITPIPANVATSERRTWNLDTLAVTVT